MDNKELNKEELVNETLGEEIKTVKEEVETLEEEIKVVEEDSKGVKFFKKILGSLIDQTINISIALAALVAFDAILRLAGFYVAEREPMFLILYVIVNVLYRPICSSIKLKETIGMKIMTK